MTIDQEDWEATNAPLGVEWSGRARYAAAVSFFNHGMFGVDVLEIYRILSRLDHEDPALRLSTFENGRGWLEQLRLKA